MTKPLPKALSLLCVLLAAAQAQAAGYHTYLTVHVSPNNVVCCVESTLQPTGVTSYTGGCPTASPLVCAGMVTHTTLGGTVASALTQVDVALRSPTFTFDGKSSQSVPLDVSLTSVVLPEAGQQLTATFLPVSGQGHVGLSFKTRASAGEAPVCTSKICSDQRGGTAFYVGTFSGDPAKAFDALIGRAREFGLEDLLAPGEKSDDIEAALGAQALSPGFANTWTDHAVELDTTGKDGVILLTVGSPKAVALRDFLITSYSNVNLTADDVAKARVQLDAQAATLSAVSATVDRVTSLKVIGAQLAK